MAFKAAALLALTTAITAPTTAHAFGGFGCFDLPAYNRALGVLQGLSTCGMSLEEARRIVAAHDGRDGPAVADRQALPMQPADPARRKGPVRHRAPHSR